MNDFEDNRYIMNNGNDGYFSAVQTGKDTVEIFARGDIDQNLVLSPDELEKVARELLRVANTAREWKGLSVMTVDEFDEVHNG